MAKLGSTKRPLVLRVASDESAMAAVAICEQHGWHYILGMEPDKPEDLRDLGRALRRTGRSDESGAMVPFVERFPDIARLEMRTAMVGPGDTELPEDDYAFVENYCAAPSCDCRRVLIAVMSERQRAQVATINHAFDPPSADDVEEDQTFLDPLNPQSDLSPALIELFEEVALGDEAYCRRLERHYDLMKGNSGTRRIVAPTPSSLSVAPAHRTIAPLRRSASALTPDERAREANRRKRARQKARKKRR
jgi:hypothetical protein